MSLPLPRVRTWGLFSCRDYTPQLQGVASVAGRFARAFAAGGTPSRSLFEIVVGCPTSGDGGRRASYERRLVRQGCAGTEDAGDERARGMPAGPERTL